MNKIPRTVLNEEIPRLRRQIDSLKNELYFVANGGTVRYACDFSELYDYLIGTPEESSANSKSNDILYDDSHAAHTAGLTSFFNSSEFGSIAILPPHAKELWAFIQFQHRENQRVSRVNGKFLEGLDQKDKEIILNFGTEPNSEEGLEELLPTLTTESEELCIDIASSIDQLAPSIAIDRLRRLVKNRFLTYEIESLFSDIRVILPKSADLSRDETLDLFELFPKRARKKSKLTKINDCRALLYLRELNKSAEKAKIKFVILTRDRNIRSAIWQMSNTARFCWPLAHSHVRTMTGLQYHFLLLSIECDSKKMQLLNDADSALAEVEQALHGSETTSQSRYIEDALENLRQHLSLNLSLSLRDILHGLETRSEQLTRDSESGDLRESFSRVIRSSKYREIVTRGAEKSWNDFYHFALFAFLLEHLQHSEAQLAIKVFESQEAGSKMVASFQGEVALTLNFKNPKLQNVIDNIQLTASSPGDIGATVTDAINDVVAGETDSEGFVFIAFICCTRKLWSQALQLLRSRYCQPRSTNLKIEALYLSSFANRRLARRDKQQFTLHLNRAFDAAMGAIAISTHGLQDARLALEVSTTVLLYHHLSKTGGRPILAAKDGGIIEDFDSAKRPSDVGPSSAIALLTKALDHSNDNTWLQITILNNLAYCSVLGFNVTLEKALHYCDRIHTIFEQMSSSESHITEPWPSLEHTITMVDAFRAYRDQDKRSLRRLTIRLEEIVAQDLVSATDKSECRAAIVIIDSWLNELSMSDL